MNEANKKPTLKNVFDIINRRTVIIVFILSIISVQISCLAWSIEKKLEQHDKTVIEALACVKDPLCSIYLDGIDPEEE